VDRIDEVELIALRDAPIAICDTACGQFEEQKKRDMERAYQKMSAVEKEVFKRNKMAEVDEADAGDGGTQCVEANGAGAGASNDRKQTNHGVI